MSPEQIRDLHIAQREENIGFYAGFLGASYMIGRGIASIFWGIVADRIGRKPVLVFSLFTTVVFNTLFGLSVTYWMAITSRFLLGALNGSLASVKAYSIEVCRDEHQALGLSIVSTAWGLGLVVGPAVGGYLAQPVKQYPHIFHDKSTFGRFPYFLPCLCISLFTTSVLLGCMWLPIFSLWTVSDRKYGGLSFSSKDVGQVLAAAGASLLIYQVFVYHWLDKILGPINSARITSALSIPVVAAYPFMTRLSGLRLDLALYSAAMIKSVLAITRVTGTCLLQNNAVPQEQRGAANGIATTAMSLFKAVAPAGAGILFTWAQKRQHASFFPGDQMLFLVLNSTEALGLFLTFKPFLEVPQQNTI